MPDPSVLLTGIALGESPRWHDGRLWFADWAAQQLVAVDMDGRSEVIGEVPSFPFSVDWLPDGTLLIVSASTRSVLRSGADGDLLPPVDLSGLSAKPWNEIVVDGRGKDPVHRGREVARRAEPRRPQNRPGTHRRRPGGRCGLALLAISGRTATRCNHPGSTC